MRVVSAILYDYKHAFDEVRIVRGEKGSFVLSCDGTVLFSKRDAGRHVEPDEAVALVRAHLGPGVPVMDR